MIFGRILTVFLLLVSFGVTGGGAEKEIRQVAKTLPRSSLNRVDLLDELQWFADVGQPIAKRLDGAVIRSCSEPLPVHEFERDVLAPLFTKLTGIRVEHDVIHEGEVVNRFSDQISTGRRIYHDFILDADNIGLVTRSEKVLNLTEFMAGEGKGYTSKRLDLDDFVDLKVVQDYDGDLYQLPDQSFPILYWYRKDWFSDPATRKDYQTRYGTELRVPETWAEYEQIAEFFTGRTMTNPDGSTVKAYGHLDYYRVGDYGLGWRIADVQLGNAGVGDRGLPNGLPVDEYGIRVVDGVPVGATVERGGALDGPAAVYALKKYVEWQKWAPPEAKHLDWSDMARALGKGNVAQTIYFCSVFTNFVPAFTTPGPLCDADGRPVWKMVPQPRGKYWQKGMKIGYKDVGSHTICSNVRHDFRLVAWLWAQFCTSKATSLAKFEVGVTPIRKSTLQHPWVQANAYRWGGLVDFYLSEKEEAFTDTGLNVPHYPAIAALWYKHVSMVVEGVPPNIAMRRLAVAVEDVMARIDLPRRSPKLAECKPRAYWLKQPGAPKGAVVEDVPVELPPQAAKAKPTGEILIVCAERFPDAFMHRGEVRGIQADFVAAALRDAGFRPTIQILPIRRCIRLIETGAADGMFPVIKSNRMNKMMVCHPDKGAPEDWRILTLDHVVITHHKTAGTQEYGGDWSTLAEPVRMVHGDPFVNRLQKHGIQVEAVQHDRQNLKKLIRDQSGSVILPSFMGEEMSQLPGFHGKLYIHDKAFCSHPTFLGFSRASNRISQEDRQRIWKHLQENARDHVAINVAFATATRAKKVLK